MKKRIYKSIFIVTFMSILAATLISIAAFYNLFSKQMDAEIKHEAYLMEKSLNHVEHAVEFLENMGLAASDDRVTLVSGSGYVLFDSYETASHMSNHSERPEIIEAMDYGFGNDKRYSSTLGKETYYYATKLNDGTILRVSKTTNSFTGVFLSVIPYIALMLVVVVILTNYISIRATRRIIEPLSSITPENLEIYDELSPFVREIYKQREQLQSQLSRLEERRTMMSAILDGMNEGLILLDKNGIVISANSNAIKTLQSYSGAASARPASIDYSYEGKNILELTRDIIFLENIKTAAKGKSSYVIIELNNKTFQVFFNTASDIGVIILFFDITEKAMAEKIRREFSANVSHELRTPLTTALGFIELIDDGLAKPESVPLFIKKVRAEISRLILLTEDITKLSELDEATVKKDFEQFELREAAATAIERISTKALSKSVDIRLEGGRFNIFANRTLVEELFFNLLENSVKYNHDGGSIDISLTEDTGTAIINVCDTGIGIPQEHLDRIFERFYRVDKSRSKKTGGTGLGLSIVKHIAMYHSGGVSVKSEEGVGTTMTVTLSIK